MTNATTYYQVVSVRTSYARNTEPTLVRIHSAFDESVRKIVVDRIGRHIPNYT
jgi:hypothetical protein